MSAPSMCFCCAVLFLLQSLFPCPNSFASIMSDQQRQLTSSSREMPTFLDGSAALLEEEEENAEGRGEEAQFRMGGVGNDGIRRWGGIGQQREENGAEDIPRRGKPKEFAGMESISDKMAPSRTAMATTTTTVGPTPPLSKQRMRQPTFEGDSIYHSVVDRMSQRGEAARAFASGRYAPPAQRPPMLPRMPSHQPDDPSGDLPAHKKLSSPPLSFRSPTGQYAPLWSPAGAAFAVPSPSHHLDGIAYYAPNFADGRQHGTAAAEAAHHPITAAAGEPKRPPVLLIGAFPPSAKVRPLLSPPSPHFVSHYSPPNPPIFPPSSVPLSPNNFSDEFAAHSSSPPPMYQQSSPAEQQPTNLPVNFYETSPLSPLVPSGHSAGPTVPHFPTLVSARPGGFAVPSPPSVGRFIPGRPYQPSRAGGAVTTTKTVPATTTTTIKPTKTPRGDCEEQTDVVFPQPTEGPKETVPNRAVGRARIICKEMGVQFGLRTVFPFTGQIFAYDKKRIAGCFHALDNERHINISFSFSECGLPNQPKTHLSGKSTATERFHLQIVVVFHQRDGPSSVQSFFVQCGRNGAKADEKRTPLARHIEEALEELQIVPTELEQKAPLPMPTVRFLIADDDHFKEGNGVEVEEDDQLHIGQSLVVEFALQPRTEAFGFLVKNCVVRDALSGAEHEVIDSFGCSTDLNIFAHPQYDTAHDIARAHWHAFKLPDQSRVSLKCRIVVCTDLDEPVEVPRGMMGMATSSCAALPSPPFCPDLATSPSDSVLADLPSSSVARLKRANAVADGVGGANATNWTLAVRSSLCVGTEERRHSSGAQIGCSARDHLLQDNGRDKNKIPSVDHRICVPFDALLQLSSLCVAFMALALAANLFCRHWKGNGKR